MISVKCLGSISVLFFYATVVKAWEPLQVIPFDEWNVVKVLNKSEMPSVPVHVMLSHTITESCFTQDQCKNVLNSKKMSKIIPSFYVSGNGQIYVGHGWDSNGVVNLCSNEDNKPMIEISFIGTFEHSRILTKQLRAAQKLLEQGLLTGKLSNTYDLFGEWQLVKEYYPIHESNKKIFKTWPHWTSNLSQCSFYYPLYYDDDE